MKTTPRSLRLQIGLLGRTNVGKSSFLNFLLGQDVSITSPMPGTTTDVVEKAAELLPLGPVVFLDTGGFDDTSELGEERRLRARKALERSDIVTLVVEPNVWTHDEEWIETEAERLHTPIVVVVNRCDAAAPSPAFLDRIGAGGRPVICCSALRRETRHAVVNQFKDALLRVCPEEFLCPPPLLGDLVPEGGHVIFIVPIDIQAPKGRLILPQVQAIRDVLNHQGSVSVVKEQQYAALLASLNRAPDLVVCDSQVVDRMVRETPEEVSCTTFSILFSRNKGNLPQQVRGITAIRTLKDGDRVLIAEACSHHPLEEDIGRVKIPRLLREYTRRELQIESRAGRDYPANLREYALVIHCGGCMLTRREMLQRIEQAVAAKVAITNYGLCIAYFKGVLERVLRPFPDALAVFKETLAGMPQELCCEAGG